MRILALAILLLVGLKANAATYFLLTQTNQFATDITNKAKAYADTKAPQGLLTASGLTMTTGKLLGRSTAGTAAIEELTLGTGLSFAGTTLNASGGAPGGAAGGVLSGTYPNPGLANWGTNDVRAAGAIGDGTTEDTTAFQTAINATQGAGAGNGIVIITPGKYLLSTLVLSNNTQLIGIGKPTLLFKTGVNATLLDGAAFPATNVVIRDLIISGQAESDYSVTASSGSRMGISGGDGMEIRGCTISGFNGKAIWLYRGWAGVRFSKGQLVLGNTVVSNWAGIYIDDFGGVGDEYVRVVANEFSRSRIGARLNTGNLNVTGNTLINDFYGLYLAGSGNNGHGNAVGNILNHCTYPVFANGVAFGYDISHNQMLGTVTGVLVTNCWGLSFRDNSVDWTSLQVSGGSISGTNYFIGNWSDTSPPTIDTAYGGSSAVVVFQNNHGSSGVWATNSSYQGTNIFDAIISQASSLGTTATPGVTLTNSSPAAVGAQQVSPGLIFGGNGWGTSGGASQPVNFRAYTLPVQGTTPTATWNLASSINGGGYGNALTYTSAGDLAVSGNVTAPAASFFILSGRASISSSGSGFMKLGDSSGNPAQVSTAGLGSLGVSTITTSATGATNTLTINFMLYVTAATGASLTDNAGTTEFSGVAIANFTPIRLQPGGKFIGTAITYATGTSSHAW